MVRWYGSFLLRRWRLSGGAERVEVEHIQTGERALLTSLPTALEWIAAREATSAADRPASLHIVRPTGDPAPDGEPGES
jgi:hypothetical protein